jgi:hypothetical protein
MDIERKKNIIYLAGMEKHECIEIQRDTKNLEVIMVEKEVKLLEECVVDLYRIIERMQKQLNELNIKNNIVENKTVVIKKKSLLN